MILEFMTIVALLVHFMLFLVFYSIKHYSQFTSNGFHTTMNL